MQVVMLFQPQEGMVVDDKDPENKDVTFIKDGNQIIGNILQSNSTCGMTATLETH